MNLLMHMHLDDALHFLSSCHEFWNLDFKNWKWYEALVDTPDTLFKRIQSQRVLDKRLLQCLSVIAMCTMSCVHKHTHVGCSVGLWVVWERQERIWRTGDTWGLINSFDEEGHRVKSLLFLLFLVLWHKTSNYTNLASNSLPKSSS